MPNALLIISGDRQVTVPHIFAGQTVFSTPVCIAVICSHAQEGMTTITLGRAATVNPGHNPSFDDFLETPGRRVIVATVEAETILEMIVPDRRTRVRIWVNHPVWADSVAIGIEV
ncbi:hypothetical protein [Aquabacter spiritensis]|uniref:Uncharacterized protein n=1 Tax=Aquabacter spiritensis TaxID=933073 RepID=A0A4R3LV51_9HYPH|nr:hypothetical protein [Aquabacter spiritensis]TCT03539.1 hypothetical protein EDC64_10989 [Aquabacter spiritensis]